MQENRAFLEEQIITYLGNKRSLLPYIEKYVKSVCKELNKQKVVTCDIFSGSGIVSRLFKQYSEVLYTNDLERYSYTLSDCYLTDKSSVNFCDLNEKLRWLNERVNTCGRKGFISEMYSPKNDKDIKIGERVFYTNENAQIIDTARYYINELEEKDRKYFLAPLLVEASIHANTSGVFKGFYKNSETKIGQFGGNGKNALSRITGRIELKMPIFSNFECNVVISGRDANLFANNDFEFDLVYLDPPYNQHPYGSNYFMLNLINDYKEPKEYSSVSGIPVGWNRSGYNVKSESFSLFSKLCKDLKSKYLLVSFNSEGFIDYDEMLSMLKTIGTVETEQIVYNTYRGSRNLTARNLYVNEYLFFVKKY